MKPFVVNRHGSLVFPANFLGDLDFSVLDTLDQFTAVIGRDFEAKAPTGTDILARVESEAYPRRFELLRDLGQNLYWANRYSITMFDRRPTRWRDLAKRRDDVFLPVLTPWEDSERKVSAVEQAFRALPPTWDGRAEDTIFDLLFDLFRTKLYHATELPPIKPTVAEFLAQPDAMTFVMPSYDPDYPVFTTEQILDAHEDVPELEALMRWAMVLHNQYPWDRSGTELRGPGEIGDDDFVVAFHPRTRDVMAFIERVKRPHPVASRHGRQDQGGAGRAGHALSPGAGAGGVRGPAEVRGAGDRARRARLQQRRRHQEHQLLLVADERGRDRREDRHRAAPLHQPGARGTGAARRAGRAGQIRA